MADDSSFVSFTCPSCRQELEAPADMAGESVECPSCGARIAVAADESPTPAQLHAMKSRTIRIELGDL